MHMHVLAVTVKINNIYLVHAQDYNYYHAACHKINSLEFFHIRPVFETFTKSLSPSITDVITTKTTCT